MAKLQYAGLAILSLGMVILFNQFLRCLRPELMPLFAAAFFCLALGAIIGFVKRSTPLVNLTLAILSMGVLLAWH